MRLLPLLLILALLSCGGEPVKAPVEGRRGEQRARTPAKPAAHTVMGGETLYAIAWRYGMDYRKLAARNNIAAPHTIYPGQKLNLRGRTSAARSSAANSRRSSRGKPATKPSRRAVKTATAPVSAATPTAGWRWPAEGKVVRAYSGTVHKGIDIAGRAGDPVLAAAAGKVVYAGSGIVGYGNLLIVKHDDIYLSAYGHNRRLLVVEGERVKVGQRIAEQGSSATNSVKLHFEIRREGKPVDPKRLLPSRG